MAILLVEGGGVLHLFIIRLWQKIHKINIYDKKKSGLLLGFSKKIANDHKNNLHVVNARVKYFIFRNLNIFTDVLVFGKSPFPSFTKKLASCLFIFFCKKN